MYTTIILIATAIISYLCFNNAALFSKLALKPFRVFHDKEVYRIITHGFVHADWVHLGVNAFTFWSFGKVVETTWSYLGYSPLHFLGLYFGGMIAASLFDLIKYRNSSWYTSIGASGAVCAVLFSSILLAPWNKVLIMAIVPVPAILFGVVYLLYCQYMAKQSRDNINHNAHFYGAIFGLIYPILMDPSLGRLFIHNLLNP